jgi:hypothetical protein
MGLIFPRIDQFDGYCAEIRPVARYKNKAVFQGRCRNHGVAHALRIRHVHGGAA